MENKQIESDLKNIFLKLVSIPSPSGHEKKVGLFIQQYLSKLNWQVKIDKSGDYNDSDFGNVIAEYKNKRSNKILFVSHMDTVQKINESIVPIFENKEFKSNGKTILGSDNKASVAVLLTLAKYLNLLKINHNVILAFTTREEQGFMGSRFLNLNLIKPKYIVNVDGSSPLGTVDFQSLGQIVFEVYIYGKSSHAALNPSQGINAMKIGAKIIDILEVGVYKNDSIVNIGVFKSGTSTNIIPDLAYFKGEIRGSTKNQIDSLYKSVIETIKKITEKFKGDYKINIIENNPPFVSLNNQKLLNFAEKAIKLNQTNYIPQKASYTSDSSYLSLSGIPTITICKGGKNPHSMNESITLKELFKLYQILLTLIKNI